MIRSTSGLGHFVAKHYGTQERRRGTRTAQHLPDSTLSILATPMSDRRYGDDGKPRTRQAERRFVIAGEAWAVWEDMRPPVGPSLVFEISKIARRVHNYPANWRELPDDQLYALSWSR